jgi:hypothetical protein
MLQFSCSGISTSGNVFSIGLAFGHRQREQLSQHPYNLPQNAEVVFLGKKVLHQYYLCCCVKWGNNFQERLQCL